jgi:hypothetical protein
MHWPPLSAAMPTMAAASSIGLMRQCPRLTARPGPPVARGMPLPADLPEMDGIVLFQIVLLEVERR